MSTPARVGLLFVAVALTMIYYLYDVAPDCAAHVSDCYGLHMSILAHTADAPYRYRILAPLAAQALTAGDSSAALIQGYLVFHAVCFAALYAGLWAWLRRWTNADRAMLGVYVFAVFVPLAFRHWLLSPWAALELALLCWGLWCISREKSGIIGYLK